VKIILTSESRTETLKILSHLFGTTQETLQRAENGEDLDGSDNDVLTLQNYLQHGVPAGENVSKVHKKLKLEKTGISDSQEIVTAALHDLKIPMVSTDRLLVSWMPS